MIAESSLDAVKSFALPCRHLGRSAAVNLLGCVDVAEVVWPCLAQRQRLGDLRQHEPGHLSPLAGGVELRANLAYRLLLQLRLAAVRPELAGLDPLEVVG